MVCAVGYALTPILIRMVVGAVIKNGVIVLMLAVLSLAWSMYGGFFPVPLSLVLNVFLSKNLTNERRVLVLLPAALYFFCFDFCLW